MSSMDISPDNFPQRLCSQEMRRRPALRLPSILMCLKHCRLRILKMLRCSIFCFPTELLRWILAESTITRAFFDKATFQMPLISWLFFNVTSMTLLRATRGRCNNLTNRILIVIVVSCVCGFCYLVYFLSCPIFRLLLLSPNTPCVVLFLLLDYMTN